MSTFIAKILILLFGFTVLAISIVPPEWGLDCDAGPHTSKLFSTPFPDPFVFSESGSFYALSTSHDATRLRMKKIDFTDAPCGSGAGVVQSHDLLLDYKTLSSVDPAFYPMHASRPLNVIENWEIWSPSIHRNRAGQLRLYATIHFGYFNTAVAVFHPAVGQLWTQDRPVQRWEFEKFVAGGGAGGRETFSAYDFETVIHDGKKYAVYNYNPAKGARDARQSIFVQEIDHADSLIQTSSAIYEFQAYPGSEVAWGGLPLVEGGSLYVEGGRFYLFYSTGTYLYEDYRIGVAVSETSILGPYHRMMSDGAPAYLLQSRSAIRQGFVGSDYNAPGGPSIIADGDGVLHIAFHANDAQETPSPASCGIGIQGNCFDPRVRYTHMLPLDLGAVALVKGIHRPHDVSVRSR